MPVEVTILARANMRTLWIFWVKTLRSCRHFMTYWTVEFSGHLIDTSRVAEGYAVLVCFLTFQQVASKGFHCTGIGWNSTPSEGFCGLEVVTRAKREVSMLGELSL